MDAKNDPIGQAILEYATTKKSKDIVVSSDLCEDDAIPSAYLFRTYKEMPNLEKVALRHCSGNVLDIGAGAGCHTKHLQSKGLNVTALETSVGAVSYLQSIAIPAINSSIHTYTGATYDTLLLLMNGIGLAGNWSQLESFLLHLKTLLAPNGCIICDSTDIQYLYEEDDGSMWMDVSAEYYGNFKFQMRYNDHQTEWFDWLYVDFERLSKVCSNVGLAIEMLYEDESHYLVKLSSL